ncbi:MAG: DUF1697 domain-containing protein [Halobacteriales archaeon]|nr:DUF1697 domain-containing protein [Halobacteriales archaeon]
MALVVFLRGVNLGGKRFSPATLAKEVGATSIGAAGTFVVRGRTTQAALRTAIGDALPFEADIIICSGKDVERLVASRPFARMPADARGFVTALGSAPKRAPTLPLERPAGAAWEVRLVRLQGRFALCERRNRQGRFYPNELVEKELGVRGTTRGWDTVVRVAKALAA